MKTIKNSITWFLCMCLLLECACIPVFVSAQNATVKFTETTQQARIDFKYTFGDYSYKNILESSGSGVSIIDYNNDKLPDLYMLNGTYIEGISDPNGKVFKGTSNKLYKNNGNGTFTEVSKVAGVDDKHWSMAAAIVDFDNDGYDDIYLLNYGPNVFYRNNGNGTFSDITDKIGLKGPDKLNGFTKWSIGASFWDYNRDGRLDVILGNFLAFDPLYVSPTAPNMMPSPNEYKGQASLLFEQQANGKFIDVTKKLGLYYPDSKCMGLNVFDYDDDGDVDLFQVNDHQKNFLFRNDKGTFKEVAVASGIAVNNQGETSGSMHASLGDVDGDGLIDILVTDLTHGALYRNLGKGLFEDITEKSGISTSFSGKGVWGAALFDYDNDGDLDIVATTGNADELVLQYPLLLENDGKGKFKNVGQQRGDYFSVKRSGRCLAVWDYDNDGDLDIIVSHVDLKATPSLLRNDGGNKNNWLGLQLYGKNGPASAIGAKVTIAIGNKKLVRINQNASSYLSYSDPRIHFGLGSTKKVDRIEILWSDGAKEVYNNLNANQYISIKQGKGVLPK
jgi:enediyne biosynthesis protein E4